MELLNAIWGDGPGKRFILFKRGGQKTGGRNQHFDNNADAIAFLQEKNAAGFDVWFGLALFGDDETRKKPNALSTKSFWLDIDVGNEKPYSNIDEGAAALASFCDKLNLPLPTLVGSGTGLHAHWIMDQRVDRERWERSARSLKNACGRNSLLAGPERTADIASVLRIPGTKHLKDPANPKDVLVFGAIQPVVELARFEQALAPYIVIDNARQANKVFETNLPQLPYDAEKIADGCGVIQKMRDTRGNVPEPIWYGALQVLHHCVDGEEFAHKWSEGYEGYTYQGTEEKFERAKEFGPTLCARFGEYDPESCLSCVHRGKITTPLQLGASLSPVVIQPSSTLSRDRPDDAELGETGAAWTPAYISPPHYEVGQQGVYYFDEEAEKRIPILDVPLWVSQLTDTTTPGNIEVTFEWVTILGVHRQATMRNDLLADQRESYRWLRAHGFNYAHKRNVEAIICYMEACILVFGNKNPTSTIYERFGWIEDSFVLGDALISADGVSVAKLASRVPKKILKGLTQKGTLEAWTAATKALDDPKYLPYQFTLIATLGSILFYLMGVQGAVLSLAGDSGVGKTTIGSFGCSAFGNPKALEISPQSTEKAFHEQWYIAGNLPILINEAATLDFFKLSSLIYAAANGQARSTLTRNSELRESDGWQLLTIFTSNSHLLSLDEKFLNEANRRRILELTLSKSEHNLDRAVAVCLHRTMADNYGIAGRKFIQYCVANKAEITTLLQTSYDLYAKGDVDEEHRFLLWMIGVARVAGVIAEKIGIILFDTEPCYEWVVNQVKQQASTVLTPEQKGDDIFAAYTAEHQGALTRFVTKQSMWTVDVRGECAGRYTQDTDGAWSLAMPAAKFSAYARERGLDKQHLARWMKIRKVQQRTSLLVPLGSRMKCYVIQIEGSLDDD